MNRILAGAIVLASATIGLVFLRLWRRSRDRLFLMFAIAFWLYGANRLALSFTGHEDESEIWLYGIRFLSFLIILIAIVDKNRSARRVEAPDAAEEA